MFLSSIDEYIIHSFLIYNTGKAGQVRGSPFRVQVTDTGDAVMNELNGPLMMECIRKLIKDTKDYSSNTLKSLKKTINKDDMDSLLKVKESLKDIETRKYDVELGLFIIYFYLFYYSNSSGIAGIDMSKSALQYFRSTGGQMDKMLDQVNAITTMWQDVQKQIPLTNSSIMPLTKIWSSILSEQMVSY